MRENLSKETKQQIQAIEQIEYYAKRREQSEIARGATGSDVADSMIASFEAEMQKIADKNGLDLEAVLSGIENKDTIKNHGNSEQAKKEALSELKKLETKYGKTKAVLYSSYDYNHQALMQGVLDTIQEEVRGITKEHGITDPHLFEKFDLPNPEQVKEGHAKLDKLEAEKKSYEAGVILGKPEALNFLYKKREEAEKIIKEYKLNPSHLSRFTIPEREKWTEKEKSGRGGLKDEPFDEPTPTTRTTPEAPKKQSWLKEMLGSKDKEAKQIKREENERAQAIGSINAYIKKYSELLDVMPKDAGSPFAIEMANAAEKIIDGALEAYSRLKKEDQNPALLGPFEQFLSHETKTTLASSTNEAGEESAIEKIKRFGRKLFTRAIFTAAALGTNPKSTTDSRLPSQEGKKVVIENTTQTPAPETKKAEAVRFVQKHAELTAQKKETAPVDTIAAPNEVVREKTHIEKMAPAVLNAISIETPVMAEMLKEIHLEMGGDVKEKVQDSTQGASSLDIATVTPVAREQIAIEKIAPAALNTIKTTAPKPQTLKELVQKIDAEEKQKPEIRKKIQKESIEKIAPIEVKQTTILTKADSVQERVIPTFKPTLDTSETITKPIPAQIASLELSKLRTIQIPERDRNLILKTIGEMPLLPNILFLDTKSDNDDKSLVSAGKTGRIKISADAMDTTAKMPRFIKQAQEKRDSLVQPEVLNKQIFEKFKENLKGRIYTDPNTYRQGLQTIITFFELNKVAPSWFMQPEIQAPLGITEKNANLPQSLFRTVGGQSIGQLNTFDIAVNQLNHMQMSLENFNVGVIGFFHEYIHAWEKSSVGIEDHNEREAIAHYFSLFPSEFSSWRRENFRPREADGSVSKTKMYEEIQATFPGLDEQHKIMYATDFEDYYAKLPPAKQVRYKAMHEKVLSLINTFADKYNERRMALDFYTIFPKELAKDAEEREKIQEPTTETKMAYIQKFKLDYQKLKTDTQEKYKGVYEKVLEIEEFLKTEEMRNRVDDPSKQAPEGTQTFSTL
jgi:hypothetical protein